MNKNLDNLALYEDWEKNTAKLCEIGEKANKYIEKKYFSSDYLEFFTDRSPAVLDFIHTVSYRHQFWLTHPLRSKRVHQWLNDLDYFISTACQTNNKLGLLKEFVWAKFSTLPLISSISNELKQNNIKKKMINILESMNAIEVLLKDKSNFSCDVLLIERNRLPAEVVRKINKQRFLNVYQISLAKLKKNIFCEVIETWSFNKEEENISLSLPLSIGCVARCKMCEFSLFKAINIPSATLIQMIDYQIRNNHEAPFVNKPKYNFYYLGGGDALQYKELPSVLTYVANSLANPNQVISTIAFGSTTSFRTFLEKICLITNIHLQWSLMSFNEATRKFITGCSSLLPVQSCVELLKEYSVKSKRKVTVSMMIFQEQSEDIATTKRDILRYLNPNLFRLNFANIQPNNLEFSKQNNNHLLNELHDWAVENNFESTIDSPPEQNNQLALCGGVSSTVFTGNQPYLKAKRHEK